LCKSKISKNFIGRMRDIGVSSVLEMEEFSRHTSFRIGGPAEIMVFPENESELKAIARCAVEEDIPLTFIGKGTNILAPDGMLDGITVNLTRLNKWIDFKEEGDVVTAGCGIGSSKLVSALIQRNLAGPEFLVGIPGTMGGAVAMNAGALSMNMGNITRGVRILSLSYPFEVSYLEKDEIEFSYRTFKAPFDGIVTAVTLSVFEADGRKTREKIKDIIRKRKAKQPTRYPSAGCIFKNQENISAGQLIEELGFKGYKKGGAEVSPIHANFIINKGGATSDDVRFIINKIKKDAYHYRGITLNEEIRIL